jgi:hypothetical protein
VKPRHMVTFLAAGLLLVGPAGCGIPNHTDVRVDGGGRAPGAESIGATAREAPRRTASTDVKEFTRNFLAAAAGEASTADDRVRDFISASDRQRLPERKDAPINVVRLTKEPKVTHDEVPPSVFIDVEQVGVLGPNGELQPPRLTDTSYTFRVGNVDDDDLGKRDDAGGLYVYQPPSDLLMTVDALNEYYEQQTIYFWSRGPNPRLVPDLRYLASSVPVGLRPTEVLGWLTRGPATWLNDSVMELPPGTQTIGNAPANEGRLVVNLAAPALQEQQLKRLATQLAWSLREIYPRGRLELMIRDKSVRVFDVDEQRRENPVYPVESAVESYCVLAGAIYRIGTGEDLPARPLPISPSSNRGIAAAALARDGNSVLAALVTTTGRLSVGTGNPTVTDFATSTELVGPQARPVWLRGFFQDSPVGLVVVGGRLYRFDANAQLVQLRLSGVEGPVTAISAAQDGRRIALIARGRLFVASLDATNLEVARVRPVPLSLHEPTAVAWWAENDLVVAGENGSEDTTLVDVTPDGGRERPRLDDDLGAATVTYLAAYPYNPARGGGPLVMYEANGAVWSGASPTKVEVDQLQGADPAAVGRAGPTAPFFLY